MVLADSECTGGKLATELEKLLNDRAHLEEMSVAGQAISRPDAADQIAILAENAAKGNEHFGRQPGKENPGS